MKKICIIIILVVLCFVVWKVAEVVTINNIQIDAVDELERGTVTIKVNGQYYDYKYEFLEDFKTFEERQAEK